MPPRPQSIETKDGDSEVLGLCLALRSGAAPAAAEAGAKGAGRGKARRGGKPAAGAPRAAEVVLLTADKALQVSAMLEGVRTMPIVSWMEEGA